MNSKALIWVIFGAILILGGLVLSVREGREIESRGPRPVTVTTPHASVPASSGDTRASGDTYLFPDGNRNMRSPEVAPADKKFDTGFEIDPIRGLKRKDENAEYFK